MRARPSDWMQYFAGYNDGIVFMSYKNRYGLNAVRKYMYPSLITSQNVSFGLECKGASSTWVDADSSFQADMQLYADAWNETQQPGREPMRDLSGLNLFVKGCFAAADAASFDLSTLTVENFGGEVGDLLGTEAPNVGNLITTAGLPSCDLDLSTLNSPIVAA